MNFNGAKVTSIVNKDEEQFTKYQQTHKYNLTTGDLFNAMWEVTIQKNPEYENIKEFESKNLHIENYNQQLKLLGYYTINNYSEFKKNINLLINFDIKNMNNIPSIFIKNENNEIDELKNRWNKNVYNIFSTMLKAIKMSDEKKEKIINNNYKNIIENFNKNKYYKNVNEILGI